MTPSPTTSACDESPPSLLLDAIAQFNRGEYFEQHETLERLWRAEPRQVRGFYQGVLQVGVAFHHLRRGNFHGATSMLTRGMRHLEPFAPRCQGVDVTELLADAGRALDEIKRLGPGRLDAFDWSHALTVRLRAP